ncbi:chemotaxis protein CheB [Sphingobium cupriresistens]|uniref:chemotaxis protein CheB n=1 Tax=Sphingobium cupriresistens TaxID=1132417 RepID=UPI003BF4DEE0
MNAQPIQAIAIGASAGAVQALLRILPALPADAYGPALAGIVLTGANHDGAAGLAAVADAGGFAIAQEPAEAQVATMPAAALAACPSASAMTLDDMILYLLTLATT